MSKIIVNLDIKKGDSNNNSATQLTHLKNSLLMSIAGIPEKYSFKCWY